ncbi:hypothetical protein PN462_18010 [Spirulina sp. CS-785/01]|uniref:hypothetical protein n=1 Tax=Spirulina sp. CS-785/01 TaxID=3021716 RepID=UPI00232BAA35|nr:hypothetical protein [Spirulina sp. CS-785/01]MDB9315014.1 hypothetical protein [Spirulina sp. CS-785/01]
MNPNLLLQIFGNSDILVNQQKGYETLQDIRGEKDLKQYSQHHYQQYKKGKLAVQFPLIEQTLQHLQQQYPHESFIILPLLTDQRPWIKEKTGTKGDDWKLIASKDGHWWENILKDWSQQQNKTCHPRIFSIESETDVSGAANWEKMAKEINLYLANLFTVNDAQLDYHSPEKKLPINRLFIQHSSGTPALSSALYLWGVEQKLQGVEVEFIYITENEDYTPSNSLLLHTATQWQWRLKVPQIQQLLAIQDFSGAREIVESHIEESFHRNQQKVPDNFQAVQKELKTLDQAVSLNLSKMQNTSQGESLTGREAVLERLSIALWSEFAFRKRGQWMHWYLRVAGAFELTICLLLEQQSQGQFTWQGRDLIYTPPSDPKQQVKINRLSIVTLVVDLLTDGDFKDNKKMAKRYPFLTITPITKTPDWKAFKRFYTTDWQILEEAISHREKQGFTHLRNSLFHSLVGDSIDEDLDQSSRQYEITDSNHPTEVAIQHLYYLLSLANLKPEIEQRMAKYQHKVTQLKEQLKLLY